MKSLKATIKIAPEGQEILIHSTCLGPISDSTDCSCNTIDHFETVVISDGPEGFDVETLGLSHCRKDRYEPLLQRILETVWQRRPIQNKQADPPHQSDSDRANVLPEAGFVTADSTIHEEVRAARNRADAECEKRHARCDREVREVNHAFALLISEFLLNTPEFDYPDREVNGGDLVDQVAQFRKECLEVLDHHNRVNADCRDVK